MRRTILLLAATIAAASLSAQPQRHPNSEKYRDTSIPSARVQAGDAVVETRALLNRDASTDVEVQANGTLTRVQTRVPTAGDAVTTNFNNLSAATFTTKLHGLVPHDSLHVQAHVQGGPDAPHDVVNLEEVVKRRPDLEVTGIIASPHALSGDVTNVRATIRERNGDVGARANCRLLADGTEVDRAEGIWVDAGGTVQCAFAPVFDVLGSPAIQLVVTVDGVDPGDWDDGNNTSAPATITVYEHPSAFGTFTASAREDEFETHSYTSRSWSESSRDTSGVEQIFRFEAYIWQDVNLSGLSATVAASSGGQTLYSGTAGEWQTFETPIGSRCAFTFGMPDVQVCQDPRYGYTHVEVYYAVADATYRSYGWATRRHPWAPEEPLFTWDDTFVADSLQARFGSQVELDVALSDGFHLFREQPVIPLQQTSSFFEIPYQCYFSWFTNEEICTEQREQRSISSGTVSVYR